MNAFKTVYCVPMPNYRLALIIREFKKRGREQLASRKHWRMENVSAQKLIRADLLAVVSHPIGG